jgi:hypothetical protein
MTREQLAQLAKETVAAIGGKPKAPCGCQAKVTYDALLVGAPDEHGEIGFAPMVFFYCLSCGAGMMINPNVSLGPERVAKIIES